MDKFYIQKEDIFGRDLRIYFRRKHGDAGFAYAQPVEMKFIPHTEEHLIHQPMMRITPETAQNLMDTLWDLGFKPSEGSGSAGAMAATQKHLEDMRKLVFNSK